MKIWHQHGSEHSANLVMIGHFENAADTMKAKEIIDALTMQVARDEPAGTLILGRSSDSYGHAMLDLLGRLNVTTIVPGELEQFAYEVRVEVQGKDLVVTTEEYDISAFLKVLLQKGARIEIYSAHDYPNTAHGRGQ